jgi:hypothetical protein
MEAEVWLPVVGYEERYSVSSLGRIRSNARVFVDRLGRTMTRKERVLRLNCSTYGYPTFSLEYGKAAVVVHKVVMLAFVGPRPPGLVICHCDGNKKNPALSNLRYGTPAENEADKDRHGTRLVGEAASGAKLTTAQVLSIRRDVRPTRCIASQYGVTKQAINSIKSRRTWAHLG